MDRRRWRISVVWRKRSASSDDGESSRDGDPLPLEKNRRPWRQTAVPRRWTVVAGGFSSSGENAPPPATTKNLPGTALRRCWRKTVVAGGRPSSRDDGPSSLEDSGVWRKRSASGDDGESSRDDGPVGPGHQGFLGNRITPSSPWIAPVCTSTDSRELASISASIFGLDDVGVIPLHGLEAIIRPPP
jgi:hypothetical protein